MGIKLVNDSTALLSMRDSDFDAYSAFGEIIDNSIQAEAKNILIHFKDKVSNKRKGYRIIEEIAFADDGYGMSADILHRCLQLGYSSRYNDRKGIGRFGVGMTLGAISQCEKIEVYSKEKNKDVFYTYIDIEDITSTPPKMKDIPVPVKKNIPKDYKNIFINDSGTLVLLSKYDKQPASADEIIEDSKIWIGRTFRKYIWNNINIEINGEKVFAIDPLYSKTEKTKFPNDPTSFMYEEIKFPWPIPENDRTGNLEESEIVIRLSRLPEEFRKYIGSGNSKLATDRYINMNEGISILRNNREVFYGEIPYWKPAFEEIDRWWGCEILFNPELDKCFTVKNIKRGAVPNQELKKVIMDKVNPTKKSAVEKVQEVWRIKKMQDLEDRRKEIAGKGLLTGHEDAEKTAKDTPTDKGILDKEKNKDEEADRVANDVIADANAQQRAAWATKFASQPFTIIDRSWKSPQFFDIEHLGGSDVITYNIRHLFFDELEGIETYLKTQTENDIINKARNLRSLIDLLIISYSKAETKFDPNDKWTADKFLEDLKLNWGQYLNRYLETWKKEK